LEIIDDTLFLSLKDGEDIVWTKMIIWTINKSDLLGDEEIIQEYLD